MIYAIFIFKIIFFIKFFNSIFTRKKSYFIINDLYQMFHIKKITFNIYFLLFQRNEKQFEKRVFYY